MASERPADEVLADMPVRSTPRSNLAPPPLARDDLGETDWELALVKALRRKKPRYYLVNIVLHKCETELIRIETNGIDVLTVNIMAMRLRRADPPGGGFNRVLAEDDDSSPGGAI